MISLPTLYRYKQLISVLSVTVFCFVSILVFCWEATKTVTSLSKKNLLEGHQVFPKLLEWLGNQSRRWTAVRVGPGSQGTTWKEPRKAGSRKTGHSATWGMSEGQPILWAFCHSLKRQSLRIGDSGSLGDAATTRGHWEKEDWLPPGATCLPF